MLTQLFYYTVVGQVASNRVCMTGIFPRRRSDGCRMLSGLIDAEDVCAHAEGASVSTAAGQMRNRSK
jgi:hypothetical protein